MQGQEQLYVPNCFDWYEVPLNELAKGRIVERRKAKRNQIQVDIEIAHPGARRCGGYAENISRTGVSIILWDGEFPTRQRSVILDFKVWTGSETLYRKIYARVVRLETKKIALEFAEHDFIAEAIIQDLMFYQNRERRAGARVPVEYDKTVAVSTSQVGQTV
jgi:c-di-GMP-binding flagellar brake protein YcgR